MINARVRTPFRLLVVVAVVMAMASFGFVVQQASADTAPVVGLPATVSADALPTWQVNGVVWNQIVVGNTVYATGKFDTARPPGVAVGGAGQIAANNIFAYDIRTGNPIANFSHTLNAQGLVVAASPDGSRVYVGGDFTTVDGQARGHVAAFDTATGKIITTFAPSLSGQVRGIVATNSTAYVGGNYLGANGATRTRLAAFTASNGTMLPWTAAATGGYVWTMVMSPDASRIVVGGSLTQLAGQSAYGMGAVAVTTGAVLPWAATQTIQDAGAYGAITSLRADATQVYGSGYAFGAGSSFEGEFALNPTTGAVNWLNDCHGDTYDVAPIGDVLYSVSHHHDCSAIGEFKDTNPRTHYEHATAFTKYATGLNTGPDTYGWNYSGIPDASLLQWYPHFAVGSYTGQYQAAWSIVGNSTFLALGGEFPSVNGTAQQGLVRFAVKASAPNKRGPQNTAGFVAKASSFSSGTARISWGAVYDQDNKSLTYDLFRDGTGASSIVNTQKVDSQSWNLPAIGYEDSGLAPGSTHIYQVRVTDPSGNVLYGPKSTAVTIR